jgi:hypothetical protein
VKFLGPLPTRPATKPHANLVKRRTVIVARLDSYLELLGPATNDNDSTKQTTIIRPQASARLGLRNERVPLTPR